MNLHSWPNEFRPTELLRLKREVLIFLYFFLFSPFLTLPLTFFSNTKNGRSPPIVIFFLLLYFGYVAHVLPRAPLARVRFCPKTIYFIPVQVQIILYELPLNYYSTSKIFFKNLFFFWVQRTPVTLKNVKIPTVLEFNEIRLGS